MSQSKVFAPFLAKDAAGSSSLSSKSPISVVDESMAMMSFAGTLLMSFFAGKDVISFISNWISSPTWYQVGDSIPLLSSFSLLLPMIPLEILYLTVNFVGNWNAKSVNILYILSIIPISVSYVVEFLYLTSIYVNFSYKKNIILLSAQTTFFSAVYIDLYLVEWTCFRSAQCSRPYVL